MKPDIIVVGSGFGGAVLASRLAAAGMAVVVLERGPWRDTVAVRAAGIEKRKPLPRTGGMLSVLRSLRPPKGPKTGLRLNKYGYLEMWIGDGIKVPCTSNVGGGSHIWAALVERAPQGFWDDRAAGLSDATLAPHYDRVAQELKGVNPPDVSAIPNHADHAWSGEGCFAPLEAGEQPPMGILFPGPDGDLSAVTDENGIVREPLDVNSANGMFGSPGASKATVDALFLLPALKNGLIVRDMHEARRVSANKAGGWTVEARDLRNGRNVTLAAPRLAVCAGTMNTNALLLSSRDSGGLTGLRALGTRLSANGDLIGKWPAEARDTTIGPPSFGRVKIKGHEDSAYVILAAGEPPPVPRFLGKGARRKAGRFVDIVAMSQDAADGRVWSENGRIRFCVRSRGIAQLRGRDAGHGCRFGSIRPAGRLSGKRRIYRAPRGRVPDFRRSK